MIRESGGTAGAKWEIVWRGDDFLDDVEKRVAQNIERAAIVVQNDIVRSMKPGTGRIYFKRRGAVGKRKRVGKGWSALNSYIAHQASAPGQPPAPDTGKYRQSIHRQLFKKNHEIIGVVGTDLDLGAWLEFGTRKMAPRPHIRPAFQRQFRKIIGIVGNKITR